MAAAALAVQRSGSAARHALRGRAGAPGLGARQRGLAAGAAWTTAAADAVAVRARLGEVSVGFAGLPAVSSTTHEGMMRLLQQRQVDLPPGILSPRAMAGLFSDGEGAEVLDRGFPWSDHEYLDGAEENARVLGEYEARFAAQTGASPPEWTGLEVALDDAENLRASLDLAVAYIKNYELDRCEVLLGRYALPACRARGMPWIVKAAQDYATLRMKQNRQAEALLLLEQIEAMLPPHPIMLHNLGLAYNSLRMNETAMQKFQKAVELNKGVKKFDDYWNIGITLKHMKRHKEAFLELIKAMELAPGSPNVDDVTLAKLNDSIGGCLQGASEATPEGDPATRVGLAQEAEPYFREAVRLYRGVIGPKHHLYGSACHLLARNLISQGRHGEAEPPLHEAMWIEALKNGVHPTPCHQMLTELLSIHEQGALEEKDLEKYHDLLRVMLMHLHCRGFLEDGNGGVVMQAVAKVLLLSGQQLARPALALLRKGIKLVECHTEDVEDTSWIQLMMQLDIRRAETTLALPSPEGHSVGPHSERWLLEGPWGVPEGSDASLGVRLTATGG